MRKNAEALNAGRGAGSKGKEDEDVPIKKRDSHYQWYSESRHNCVNLWLHREWNSSLARNAGLKRLTLSCEWKAHDKQAINSIAACWVRLTTGKSSREKKSLLLIYHLKKRQTEKLATAQGGSIEEEEKHTHRSFSPSCLSLEPRTSPSENAATSSSPAAPLMSGEDCRLGPPRAGHLTTSLRIGSQLISEATSKIGFAGMPPALLHLDLKRFCPQTLC